MLTLQAKERVTKKRKNEMKNKVCNTIAGAALTLIVAAALWLTSVSAQSGNAHGDAIVGLWDVVVENRACDGPTIGTFVSMHKFELGGTAQTVPSTSPVNSSAHVGIWNHQGQNNYNLAFKAWRYDPAGNCIGWTVVRFDIVIDEQAETSFGTGQAQVYDTTGNIVSSSCPTFTGKRFR
jgi:hypothetical protein